MFTAVRSLPKNRMSRTLQNSHQQSTRPSDQVAELGGARSDALDVERAASPSAPAGRPGRRPRRSRCRPAPAPVSRLLRFTYSNSVMSSSGPEHLVEEPPQRARLLRELDQEVVLAALRGPATRSTISPYRLTSLLPPDSRQTTVSAGLDTSSRRPSAAVDERAGGLGDDARRSGRARASRSRPRPRAPAIIVDPGGRDQRQRDRRRPGVPRRRRRRCPARSASPARRPRARRPCSAAPGRLDADDPVRRGAAPPARSRSRRAGRRRRPGRRGRPGALTELLDDLDRDGALAGDGPRVVEGRHQRRAGALRRRPARRRPRRRRCRR